MHNSERKSTEWSEPRIESLLSEFYEAEMPPGLRVEASRAPAITGRRPVAASGTRPIAALAGLIAVAICLAAVVGPLWRQGLTPSAPSTALAPQQIGPGDSNTPESVVESFVSETEQPIERLRYDTETGPVEQRTNLRWTNVSIRDQESGEDVELMIPELQIDVFPIDEEPPETGKTADDDE